MTKEQEISFYEEKIRILKEEIKLKKKNCLLKILENITYIQRYISKKGKIWYKYSVESLDINSLNSVGDIWPTKYFLTDLKGHYIEDKLYYEGRPCAPGWAVKAFYCRDEQQAIDCYEDEHKL